MKKKLLSVLLVGAMMATMLTGCGGGSDTPAAPAADSGSSEAAPAADSGSSEEAAPAADAAAGGEETLTVWCWDPAFNMNAMYEAEKIYQKDHPNSKRIVIENLWDDVKN